MTTDQLQKINSSLQAKLVPFIQKLTEQTEKPNETLLKGHYPEEQQRKLCLRILEVIGYDFNRGRLDTTEHPFTTSVGPDDARITTNFKPWNLAAALFATSHEAGHAIFQQGQDPALKWIYLDNGYSHGLHESQARMFENLICRSLPFWKFFYPELQNIFPNYKNIPLKDFYRAINIVKPSLIRIYADEVTYNLHIMVRFEIEEALLNGKIDVADLPAIWNEKIKKYLGIIPPNDSQGVLQDVHWSKGAFGYFPTYMLGNLYSAQISDAIKREIPYVNDIAEGKFNNLLEWLRVKIHRFGKIREAPELLQAITGKEPIPEPWLDYVTEKFSAIYGLS